MGGPSGTISCSVDDLEFQLAHPECDVGDLSIVHFHLHDQISVAYVKDSDCSIEIADTDDIDCRGLYNSSDC